MLAQIFLPEIEIQERELIWNGSVLYSSDIRSSLHLFSLLILPSNNGCSFQMRFCLCCKKWRSNRDRTDGLTLFITPRVLLTVNSTNGLFTTRYTCMNFVLHRICEQKKPYFKVKLYYSRIKSFICCNISTSKHDREYNDWIAVPKVDAFVKMWKQAKLQRTEMNMKEMITSCIFLDNRRPRNLRASLSICISFIEYPICVETNRAIYMSQSIRAF